MPSGPHVLVAALDWGLGHATRMVPLIQLLVEAGVQVHLGGSGHGLTFLREQFPALPFLELPAYRVRYSKGPQQGGAILRQVPRLLGVIRQENRLLRRYAREFGLAAVISDNRYGLHLPDRPSVFITHQLYPLSPWSWLQPMVNRLHARVMRNFDEIWVPDEADNLGFSGKLSHPASGRKLRYIGLLSRFMLPEFQATALPVNQPQDYLLAILSGPEPQRSMWEEKILEQATNLGVPTLLARGKPGHLGEHVSPLIETKSWIGGAELGRLISGAGLVVSRPGYSSLMDYAFLSVPGLLLVPTPGQTEQEYLAEVWEQKVGVQTQTQQRFNLENAWGSRLQTGAVGSLLKAEDQLEKLRICLQEFISRLGKDG